MIAGNTESINKIESMGAEVINNSKIYIKFICAEEEAEKINL